VPNVTITDYQTFEAMRRYGGSFAKAIAEAATRAELIEEYRTMAAIILAKETRS